MPAKKASVGAHAPGSFGAQRTVKTASDFDEFIQWLEQPGKMNERKAAYLSYAKERGMPIDSLLARKGEARYLEEAKAGVIARASGAYVSKLLSKANQFSQVGLDEESTAETVDHCLREVSKAKLQLSEFYAACAREIFRSQLRAASMNEAATDALIESLDARQWARDPLGAIIQGARQAQEGAGRQLSDAFREFLEHPERRGLLLASSSAVNLADSDISPLGAFAPLIRFMNAELDPKHRAEMMARMLAYVESGWAEKDLIGGESREEIERESPWCDHAALLPWRELAGRVKREEPVAVAELLDAFALRFCEIGAEAVVGKAQVKGAELPVLKSAVLLKSKISNWEELAQVAPPKVVDVCVIAPGGRSLHLTCATADPAMLKQGNQSERYLSAIERAVATAGPQGFHLGSVKLPAAPAIIMTIFSPCLAQESAATTRRQAGEAIFEQFPGRLEPATEERIVDGVNALPMMAVAARSFGSRGSIARVRQQLVGASSHLWERIHEESSRSARPREAALSGISRVGSDLVEVLAQERFQMETKLKEDQRSACPAAHERVVSGLSQIGDALADYAFESMKLDERPQPDHAQQFERFARALERFKGMVRGERKLPGRFQESADEILKWARSAPQAETKIAGARNK